MTPFLFGTDIRARLVELINSSSEINCAVAFWGNGAEELFATSPKKSIRIICDLMSGACNPAVIRKLMSVGAAVKMVNGMHAKVYWTPVGAIMDPQTRLQTALAKKVRRRRSRLKLQFTLTNLRPCVTFQWDRKPMKRRKIGR